MRLKKLTARVAAIFLATCLSLTTGYAAPVTAGSDETVTEVLQVENKATENHFHAYAGGTKKQYVEVEADPFFRPGMLYVDVVGDDLSKVVYVWKVYTCWEDFEENNVAMTNTKSASSTVFLFSMDDLVLTCEVTDGLGNSELVVFRYVESKNKYLSPASFTLKPGETLDVRKYAEEWEIDSEEMYTSHTAVITMKDGVIKAKAPGFGYWMTGSETETFPFGIPIRVLYNDVTRESDYWYVPVNWGAEVGVVGGYSDGTFRPANDCSRAQMVSFLWRMNGCPDPTITKNPFKDVKDTKAYYYKAMLWGYEKGIVGGYKVSGGLEFRPDNVCTRAQAVSFLWRMAGKPEPAGNKNAFSDNKNKDAYYYQAVLWASEKGITGGYSDGTFRPANNCSRAQLVTFLYRYVCTEESQE